MCGLARPTAVEWVRVARALRSLPHIALAHRDGHVSWDQLRPLTKFATEETDERWSADAPWCSAAWLWQESRRHEQVIERDAEEVDRWRSLRLDRDEERTWLYLSGRAGAAAGGA